MAQQVLSVTITARVPVPTDAFQQIETVQKIKGIVDDLLEKATEASGTKFLANCEMRSVRDRAVGSNYDKQRKTGSSLALHVYGFDGLRRTTPKSYDGYVDAVAALIARCDNIEMLDRLMRHNSSALHRLPEPIRERVATAEQALRRHLEQKEGIE